MKNIVFLFLVLINSSLLACNCKDFSIIEARKYSYFDSDVIFLAKILSITDNNVANVQIIEVFKGSINFSTVDVIFKPCNIIPVIGKKWLIYSEYDKNKIVVKECSISRGFDNAYFFNFYKLPDPLPPNHNAQEEEIFDLKIKILNLQANLDLADEIDILRNKIDRQNNTENRNTDYRFILIYISIGLLFIFVIFLFILLHKKNIQKG